MKTECTSGAVEFTGVGKRKVQSDFDGGHLSSDGGVLLLRDMDERLGLMERLAGCFTDHRDPDLIEHSVDTLLRQRIFAIALGYEDLNDHDALRVDPLLALAAGKIDPEGQERRREQDRGKALASPSTLNRLELTPLDAGAGDRYKKLVYDGELIENLLVDVFLESFNEAPLEIILDFDKRIAAEHISDYARALKHQKKKALAEYDTRQAKKLKEKSAKADLGVDRQAHPQRYQNPDLGLD